MYVPKDAPPPGEWEYFKISHHVEFVMQPQENLEGVYEPIMIVRHCNVSVVHARAHLYHYHTANRDLFPACNQPQA